jgi:hypothetical protein
MGVLTEVGDSQIVGEVGKGSGLSAAQAVTSAQGFVNNFN